MNVGVGVLLVLAALTFLLAAVLQCLSLRKQEELIERLERLQEPHVRWREDPPAQRPKTDPALSSHIVSRRPQG
jgi:hypothetical protein